MRKLSCLSVVGSCAVVELFNRLVVQSFGRAVVQSSRAVAKSYSRKVVQSYSRIVDSSKKQDASELLRFKTVYCA